MATCTRPTGRSGTTRGTAGTPTVVPVAAATR